MTMLNFCINFLIKQRNRCQFYDFAVASLADAWIKIVINAYSTLGIAVASLADAWIKIV